MKSLFIANDAETYGSNKSMLNLIDELRKKNVQIQVLLPEKGLLEEELKKRNIKFKIKKYYSWIKSKDDKNMFKLYIKVLMNCFLAIPIAKWIKKEKFDIIHSVNSAVCIGAYVTKIIKIKHVWHIRELVEEDHNFEFFNKKIAIKIFNTANKIIFISKSVQNKYINVVDKDKSQLIYNGIPVDKYINSNIPIVNNDIYKILIAGNICKTKGQEDAIKAVELLKNKGIENIELYIAGNGNLKENLERYVKEKDLNKQIKFLGYINNIDEIRKNINISLMCSKNEAFGRVTVEGMMAKNLVIGANTGGTIEIIQDKKTGLLYEQGNYIDLANKIEYAMNNWNNCKKIIEEGYMDAINKYSIEKCALQVYNVYKSLLKR